MDIAPELIFEVISPSDERIGDIADNTQEWLDYDVLIVCNIYPKEKSIHVYQPNQKPTILFEDDILDGGDALPDFKIKVSDFFDI